MAEALRWSFSADASMEDLLNISRTTGNTTISTNRHIFLAQKLQELNRRVKHVGRVLDNKDSLLYANCIKINVGPPLFLRETQKRNWERELHKTVNRCIEKYLLPEYKERLLAYKKEITEVVENKSEEELEIIKKGINIGVNRANKKWNRREGAKDNSKMEIKKIGPYEEEEIGLLKRGDTPVTEQEALCIHKELRETVDVYKILAHAIHGKTAHYKIVQRNMWKYMQVYQKEEQASFKPFLGELENGTRQWIKTWSMFTSYIRNRDLKVTTYELEIVARVYDVRIRIFSNEARPDRSDNFVCKWHTQAYRDREVNLLVNSENKWVALVKIEKEQKEGIMKYKCGVSRQGEEGEIGQEAIVTSKEIVERDREVEKRREERREDENVTSIVDSEEEDNKKIEVDSENQTKHDNTGDSNELDQEIDNNSQEGSRSSKSTIQNRRELREEDIIRRKVEKRKFWQRWRRVRRDKERNRNRKREHIINKEGIKEKNKQLVFDFTTKGISVEELELLSKGETFCMTNHKVVEDRLRTDIYNYSRRLRLHDEFRESKQTEVECRSSINNTQTQQDIRASESRQNRRSSRNRVSHIINTQTQQDIRTEGRSRNSQGQNRTIIPTVTRASREGNNNTQNNRSNVRGGASSNRQHSTNRQNNERGSNNRHNDNSEIENRLGNRVDTQNRQVNYNRTPLNNQIAREESQERKELFLYNNKDKHRKLPSMYDPECVNRNLNRYINCIQEESIVVTKKKTEFRDNISGEQREALKTLKEKIDKKEIIVTKADKGSGLVVVDYDRYIEKGTKYIEEEAKAYEKIDTNTKEIIKKLVKDRDNIVQKLKQDKIIEVETATYCIKQLEEKITGIKFYYKIHKDTNIETMPLRPLQSCINAPTHHLSQVLTDILQPLLKVEYIGTYIQDSNQLLYRLNKVPKIKDSDTLISSDVAALYPSIPHEEGLAAVEDFLLTFSIYNEEQVQSIIRALKLVITENFITWNNNTYKQTSGVAMGTPVAVAYANIFMNWIDTEIRERAPFIIEHIRYIDDNLFIIPKDKIEELMNIANNILTPNIRFTYETLDREGEKGLAFLDTQLFISEEGYIESRLYTKKTDKHAYLLPTSYHPEHITENIPLAVFMRIRRLCSRKEWFQADAMKALEWLEDRGYKYKNIKKAIEKSSKEDRWKLIVNIENKRESKGVDKNEDKIFKIPFIVTYSHKTIPIKEVLKQRKALLDVSFRDTKVKPRLTFRRQNNINDLIVQKSLRGPISKEEEKCFRSCGETPKYRINCPCRGSHNQKICRCCAHAKFQMENIKVRLHKAVDCDTKNVIYLIGCNECSKKYVGETRQKVRERLMQHLYNIYKLKQPLYTHFNNIHKPSNLYITILETVKSEEQAFRKIREAWWINKLQTLEPRGFNVKLECSQIYVANHTTIDIERRTHHI